MILVSLGARSGENKCKSVAFRFKKAKTSKNAVFATDAPRRTRTLDNRSEGATWNVTSSTFRIIFYYKIPYWKSLNSFIFQHFSHFISSNNTIQYKHEKIQHKTAHLQKSCIFLSKICNINWQINNFMLTIIVNKSLKNNKNYTQPMMC